jgi:hypothetical protein
VSDGADFGDFVGPKEIGFSKNRENGKKGFCRTDLVLEKLECMGEGVTDRPAKGAKAKAMEEGFSLITDAGGTVLKVAVIKA